MGLYGNWTCSPGIPKQLPCQAQTDLQMLCSASSTEMQTPSLSLTYFSLDVNYSRCMSCLGRGRLLQTGFVSTGS